MKCSTRMFPTGIAIVLVMCGSLTLRAQKTHVYNYSDRTFRKGVELFNKEKYAAAQEEFRQVIDQYAGEISTIKADAEYYNAVCALQLFNPDAEYLIQHFIDNYPESPRLPYAYFNMGRFKYHDENFQEAQAWLTKITKANLSATDQPEYTFKLGYSYFQLNDFDKASEQFRTIKDSANMYRSPAMYYYSHIEYQKRNLETAYQGFMSLKDDETFAPVVPYYITQIMFIQKKYKEVIEYATPLMEKASMNRANEIARILGESNYRLNQYDKALPFFEKYFEAAKNITKDDNYQMGYLYYRTSQWDKSMQFLSKVTTENDTLAQNAYYHLADCYIRTGDKEKAKNAFGAAAKFDIDKAIKQDASFSFAKITYELSYSPFNEAITTFQQYIADYPNSDKLDEAYSYLVKVFMTTKNYKDALESLEKIKNRDNEMNLAYQRIAFYRGLELYNNLDFEGSIGLFNKSLTYEIFDKHLTALAYFWRGDAKYRTEKYDDARKDFQEFLTSPGALGKKEFPLAHYNMGYTYFNLKNYSESAVWFRKYLDFSNVEKDKIYCDACTRTGDSYFMLKNYDQAQKYYDQAYALNLIDADYALFQKAVCAGLLKKREPKIDIMNKLITDYPTSSYVDDAVYETAETWCALDQHAKAIPYYERIISEFSNSSYVKNSLLQLGLIYYNTDQSPKAMEVYKQFVNDYKGSAESKNALQGIKNIYIEQNDVDGYMFYVESLGGTVTITQAGQDSLSYLAGEDAYMKDNCEKAVPIFNSYLAKFPNGIFFLNAQYYKSDCQLKASLYDSARVGYEKVIAQPKCSFTEASLYNLARIQMRKGEFQAALKTYERLEEVAEYKSNLLEARVGQMRCNTKLKDYNALIASCEKLLITDKVPEEIVREANFNLAKSLLETNDSTKAMDKFRTVALDIKSVEGAESKYTVCQMLFDQGNIDDCEKEILDFMDKNSPHQYWMARAYILWADVFERRNDLFQAKNTLQSILDNYTNKTDGIIDMAQQKYDKIDAQINTSTVTPDKADEIHMKSEE